MERSSLTRKHLWTVGGRTTDYTGVQRETCKSSKARRWDSVGRVTTSKGGIDFSLGSTRFFTIVARSWSQPGKLCTGRLSLAYLGAARESDVRVPPSQGYEYYNALKRRGVTAKMVVYPRHITPEPIWSGASLPPV